MKTLLQVVAVICVLHVLAALGFVGWLAATQRVDRDRLAAAANIFRVTIPEAEKAAEEAAAVEAEAEEHVARIDLVSDPGVPTSVAQRLAEERQRNEITLRQLERTRQEIEGLRDNLQQRQLLMEQQHEELLAEKTALEKRLEEIEQRENDEGFQKAVTLYESLPSKQVKQMFLSLIQQEKTDQVISYLEAMQPRKAAAVLKEFEGPNEVAQAAELTQRLRERGSELTRGLEAAG